MSTIYTDAVFAPLDPDNDLERIGGGNETEVYRTDDARFVVKVKQDMPGAALDEALAWAQVMRAGADEFADCLGPQHSLSNHFLISRDSQGELHVIVVQPYVRQARPLFAIEYDRLSPQQRADIALHLRDIVQRALRMYWRKGRMPDLYGRTSASKQERKRLNTPLMLPWRLWSFLVERNLLRSNNLMLTDETPPQIVFVDYDIVRRGPLYRKVYYAVRWLLFVRDHMLIRLMQRTGFVPRGR